MHARMATYKYTGDIQELARRAEEGILPVFQAQDGFQAYSVAEGDGEILSLSVWSSRDAAEAGNQAVAGWVAARSIASNGRSSRSAIWMVSKVPPAGAPR